MKRWKAELEEYNHEIFHKTGRTNVVVDALSRITAQQQINSMSVMTHSDDSSGQNLIQFVDVPINVFKNQIFFNWSAESSYKFQIVFPTIHRHTITEIEFSEETIISLLKKYLNPSVINGISAPEPIMGIIQEVFSIHFNKYRIRFARRKVEDVLEEQRQEEIIIETHRRAHRNGRENKSHILEKYFSPA